MHDHDEQVEHIRKLREESALPPAKVYQAVDSLLATYYSMKAELEAACSRALRTYIKLEEFKKNAETWKRRAEEAQRKARKYRTRAHRHINEFEYDLSRAKACCLCGRTDKDLRCGYCDDY